MSLTYSSFERKSKFWDDQEIDPALLVNELIEVLDLQTVALVDGRLDQFLFYLFSTHIPHLIQKPSCTNTFAKSGELTVYNL